MDWFLEYFQKVCDVLEHMYKKSWEGIAAGY